MDTPPSASASTVSSLVGAHDVPEAVRALTGPDYADVFTVTTPAAVDSSAEEWARAVLEHAGGRPARMLWRLMGLRLGDQSANDARRAWR